jgi:uncharacterized membrane protein YedE/YeeE
MIYIVVAWVCGCIFGFGLLLSGMVNPAKVLNFLDVGGAWDPSLALVMAGAILVGLAAFGIAKRRSLSYLGYEMRLPKASAVDGKLVTGSMLFGIGWGLAGFCPGPALVALGLLAIKPVVFVLSMLCGMAIFEVVNKFVFSK